MDDSTRETSEEPDTSDEIYALIELGQALIYAILQNEPFTNVKKLIDSGAPLWYQDEEGLSALHAAAYSENSRFIKLLIEEGAVWNAVDKFQNTAGDIALSLNNEECYTLIRDAGIRAELLLTLLASRPSPSAPSGLVLRAADATAAGSTSNFLSSRLRFTTDEHGQEICLVRAGEDEEVGVMMGWERGIMQETVRRLCSGHEHSKQGLKVLNVGFGLGIIDTFFQAQSTPPSQHFIIEAHPDVLQHMKSHGWYEKPGVKILEGKWQDFIDSEEILAVGGFDVVYTDTFSEDYKDLRQFFAHLPDLLAGPESRFSFFNGLGATNALFYDVYTHLAEMHLADVGVDIEWSDVDVGKPGTEDRWGKTREYFALPLYRLPIGYMRSIS
ncbi:hypothetical protein PLICRDRAFT_37315 [Plicaturopsis crispa FD-325 SS-3]|nr:hypothetical protein PLICRDRAFT_37315 [Plicaturopsis crispa FD-325 SS-3]